MPNSSQVLGFDGSTWGPVGVYNPLQVALLKWYPANRTGLNVTVGTQPSGVAFDGTHIWVSNQGGGSVSEIGDTAGASVINTVTVGGSPGGMAFDGSHISVAQVHPLTRLSAQSQSSVRSTRHALDRQPRDIHVNNLRPPRRTTTSVSAPSCGDRGEKVVLQAGWEDLCGTLFPRTPAATACRFVLPRATYYLRQGTAHDQPILSVHSTPRQRIDS